MPKAKNGKEIIAWVSTRCPYCEEGRSIEVTDRDASGKAIVRCPVCGERIPMDVVAPPAVNVKSVEIKEEGIHVSDNTHAN